GRSVECFPRVRPGMRTSCRQLGIRLPLRTVASSMRQTSLRHTDHHEEHSLTDVLDIARQQVLEEGRGLTEAQALECLQLPDDRLMKQMREGVAAIHAAVDINVAASLGMLTQAQVDELAEMGIHRYNHNLETARSYFPSVVTTHSWEERWSTLTMVRDAGMEV